MSKRTNFFEMITSPAGNLAGVMVLMVMSLITSLVYELVKPAVKDTPGWVVLWILALVFLLVALYLIVRRSKPRVLVPKNQQPAKHRGLILLVGTGRPGENAMDQSAKDAIDFHTAAPGAGGLEFCWLVASAGEHGSLPVAQLIEKDILRPKHIRAEVLTVGDPFDLLESYQVVQKIYAEGLAQAGLSEGEVIADFTGGVKPMTAGMVLACGDRRKMQYMYGRKGGIASTPRLVEFHTTGRVP